MNKIVIMAIFAAAIITTSPRSALEEEIIKVQNQVVEEVYAADEALTKAKEEGDYAEAQRVYDEAILRLNAASNLSEESVKNGELYGFTQLEKFIGEDNDQKNIGSFTEDTSEECVSGVA